jgi:hypothetical protein
VSIKDALLCRGLFPETLPPCFSSEDCKRAFRGLSKVLSKRQFQKKRNAPPISYDGTKHDWNRRLYSTPHPIPYFYICDFIGANWKTFEKQFKGSAYSISSIRPAIGDVARAIVVTPLSEVSAQVSKKIRHAPIILKADIAQFYPSVYTHTLCWAAHGKERCKTDRASDSKKNRFNRLDFFIQNGQSGQTRGILVGPDAYRMVAEFLAVKVDQEFARRAGPLVIGAARHVDDFYIGVRSEADALAALSSLRESLYEFELHVNDLKTSIFPGVTPLDDPWASRLRTLSEELASNKTEERITSFFNDAVSLSTDLKTQSPLKLAVRRADRYRLYESPHFESVENHFQRMVHHFPHAIDYICLFIAKRVAIGENIDRAGWTEVVNAGILRHLLLGHHHEACWLFWLAIVCGLRIERKIIDEIPKYTNQHIIAMAVAGFASGKCDKPRVRFSNKIASDTNGWLVNLVSRSVGFTGASFGGCFADECEHLSNKRVQLIDFDAHFAKVAIANVSAISNVRFGYEDDDDEGVDDDDDDEFSMPTDDDGFDHLL